MHPKQVLDMQADLIARITGNPAYRRYMENALNAQAPENQEQFRKFNPNEFMPGREAIAAQTHEAMEWKHQQFGVAGREAIAAHVQGAYAYHVTPDMSLMVQHAADSLDETDVYDKTLAPTECGIVRFDRPLPCVDVRGKLMLVSFVVWGPAQMGGVVGPDGSMLAGGGLLLTCFNDGITDPDVISAQQIAAYPEVIQEVVGRWHLIGVEAMINGTALGPMLRPVTDEQQAMVLATGGTPQPAQNISRMIHALFLLMGQTVTSLIAADVDRHTVKRARKMRIPPRVTIIQLRRSETLPSVGDETLVEWSHRWIVRGHWAWRKCGPEHPFAQADPKGGHHCRVFIRPYPKGPEGKPLIITDKVFDLNR